VIFGSPVNIFVSSNFVLLEKLTSGMELFHRTGMGLVGSVFGLAFPALDVLNSVK
jgi:hypothetical protein